MEVKGCFRQPTDVCGSLELTSELLISPGDSKRSAKTVYFAYSRRWRRMSSAESKLNRSWQEIAAEASQEQDPKKLVELVEELERALNARDAEMRTASPARAAAP